MKVGTVGLLVTALVVSWAGCDDVDRTPGAQGTAGTAGTAGTTGQGGDGGSVPWLPAGTPALLFSDITSGPSSGLGDGQGQGAIVTIWGTNLGAEQGDSTVTCGGVEAAHVYYWGHADGSPEAGPARLHASHQMQTVSFSIAAATPAGATDIQVHVGGEASNPLGFVVRDGDLYFVDPSGDDSAGDGSWGSPWQHLDFVGAGADGAVSAGDIIYARDGVEETDGFLVGISCSEAAVGTPDAPIAVAAYPGATVTAAGDEFGVGNYCGLAEYWTFAKLHIQSNETGINGFKGARIVANALTDRPGGCADGMSGAITAGNHGGTDRASDLLAIGNYIHDFGCETTTKFHHTFYMTNRGGSPIRGYELAYNHLFRNQTRGGLHVYDESECGDLTTTLSIHDNVVVDQVGAGVAVGSGGSVDPCFSMDVEIFNNLLVRSGLAPFDDAALGLHGDNTRSHAKIYNNTIVGYQGAAAIRITHGGTWEYQNNIVVDDSDLPFALEPSAPPQAVGGNLWHGPAGGAEPPAWDTGPLTADPLFLAPEVGGYALSAGSPAIDSGIDVGAVVSRGLAGTSRPQGDGYDIGAYEYYESE